MPGLVLGTGYGAANKTHPDLALGRQDAGETQGCRGLTWTGVTMVSEQAQYLTTKVTLC